MRYLRAYRFLFDSTSWSLNLLAGAACQFVPVLGPIVFTGYAFDLIEAIPKRGDRDYPAFDLNRLGAYLMRGLWPLVVQMIALLPILFVAWIVAMMAVAAANADPRTAPGVPRALVAILVPIVFLVVLILSIFLAPLTLYAGLRQEIRGAGAFVKDFLHRVGREMLLAQLFVATTGTSVAVLGAAFCCVGVYPAVALVHFAQYHLLAQVYGLYLQRGGAIAVVPPPEVKEALSE